VSSVCVADCVCLVRSSIRAKYDDRDEGGGDNDDKNGWSDKEVESDLDNDSSDDSDDESDDDDEEAVLQAELAKIRAERAAAKLKEEAEEAAQEEEKMEEAALMGNPLLSSGNEAASSGRMKRRWNDDVVFRNQAKGEPETKKRFINDTVRNDFHKRFLNKFIK